MCEEDKIQSMLVKDRNNNIIYSEVLRNTDTWLWWRIAYPIRILHGYATDTYPERIRELGRIGSGNLRFDTHLVGYGPVTAHLKEQRRSRRRIRRREGGAGEGSRSRICDALPSPPAATRARARPALVEFYNFYTKFISIRVHIN